MKFGLKKETRKKVNRTSVTPGQNKAATRRASAPEGEGGKTEGEIFEEIRGNYFQIR